MHTHRFFGAAVAATLAVCTFAPAETVVIDHFPKLPQTNSTIQLRFLGPDEGTITQTRLFIDFTTSDGFDAADLTIQLVATVTPEDPKGGFWFLTGEDLGWSGQGTFTATVSTTMLNGELHPGLWGFDLGSLNDPPAFSGAFSESSRFEVDITPIPEPTGAAAALVGACAALVRRRRR